SLQIARAYWDRYYAPLLETPGNPQLGIYSHMINSFLYLYRYPIGRLIAFQLEEKLRGAESGKAFELAASYGRVLPDLWMEHPARRFAPAPPPPDAPGPPRERPRPRAGPRRACGPPQSPAVVTARLVLVPRAAPPRARPGAAHPPGPPRSARPGPPSGSATRRGRGRRRRAGRDREGGRGSFARLRPAHRAGLRPAGLLAGAEYLLRQGAVLLHIRDHDVAREDAAGALRGAL